MTEQKDMTINRWYACTQCNDHSYYDVTGQLGLWDQMCYVLLKKPGKYGTWVVQCVRVIKGRPKLADTCKVYRKNLRLLRPDEVLEI